MNILTHHINPPIPRRDFDWTATTESYEPGQPVGYGATEDEAVQDLMLILKAEATA